MGGFIFYIKVIYSFAKKGKPFILMLLQGVFPENAYAQKEPFLTNQAGGKVVWYSNLNEPHAIHFKGITYVAFHGSGDDHLDPMVVAYHHQTKETIGPIKVGENPLALYNDTHGNPAIMVDNLGYIHVMYGGHGYYEGGKMIHAVSKKPHNISEWKVLDNISPVGTYPQLVKTDDGTIYYFYRAENTKAGNHRGNWVYVISTDHGRTFSKEIPLLSGGKKRKDKQYVDGLYYEAWYAMMYKGEGNSIHVLAYFHPCAHPFKDSYHAHRRFNLYHLMMENHSDKWQNLSKQYLKTPLKVQKADKYCLLYKSDNVKNKEEMGRAFVSNLTTDNSGNPYILLSKGEGKNGQHNRKNFLMIGNKNTGIWQSKEAQKNGKLVYQKDGSLEIWSNQLSVSHDKGDTWQQTTDFPKINFAGLALVFNGIENACVVAHDVQGKTENRKIFMWGKRGFITQEK